MVLPKTIETIWFCCENAKKTRTDDQLAVRYANNLH